MTRKHNFSAGPSAISTEVLEQVKEELLDYHGEGASIMESSHRGKAFGEVFERAERGARDLLDISDDYAVLFMHGGATAQFSAIPLNLMGNKTRAGYLNTGAWSKKAMAEAKKYCQVDELLSLDSKNGLMSIPDVPDVDTDLAYLHFTDNETISGVEFNAIPEAGDVPLVCDMSSNIFSRQFDVSKFGLIYAGAQKNIGPSGLGLVILRKDLMGNAAPMTPGIFDYQKQFDNKSMLNTPPTFNIYIAALSFEWMLKNGGVKAFEAMSRRKADRLYGVIDKHSDFYGNPVHPSCRSRMNVTFTLKDESLEAKFLEEAAKLDCINLKGHRSIGGFRASIYNAVSEESVDVLVSLMEDFVGMA